MGFKLISIVMPIYNHKNYVGKAIESILSQAYADFELILVDDGSTDGSADIAKSYLGDARLLYRYKSNGGTGSALNYGFSFASGEYGTWVSSDNVYYPNCFEKLCEFLELHTECEFVFSSFDKNDGGMIKQLSNIPTLLPTFLQLSSEMCWTGICFLFTMALKRKCGDYIILPGEDYYMGVKMGFATKVGYIPDRMGMHNTHPGCLSYQLAINPSSMKCMRCGKTAAELTQDLLKDINGECSHEVHPK